MICCCRKIHSIIKFHKTHPQDQKIPNKTPLQNWLNTPDNRPGWASYFLSQGYTIYLTDSPARGRSASHANPTSSTHLSTFSADTIEKHFTAPSHHRDYPQASKHTQWPGSGRMGDPIFDAYYASTVPFVKDNREEQRSMQAAGAALLDRIGPAVLITHSSGGPSGWLIADARPGLVKGIIALEPAGPPFESRVAFDKDVPQKPFGLTDVPLTYEPPVEEGPVPLATREIERGEGGGGPAWKLQAEPARRLVNLVGVPVVVVTAEASYHAEYDRCTVMFLEQAGVGVDWLRLEEEGLRGNGHLMFLEKNNLDIARVLGRKIEGLEHTGSAGMKADVGGEKA